MADYRDIEMAAKEDAERYSRNEASVIKPRYIEDDFKILAELDSKIAQLIAERHERFDMIAKQQMDNNNRIQQHQDWFEGSIRCNPVPDRGVDTAEYDPMSTRRY